VKPGATPAGLIAGAPDRVPVPAENGGEALVSLLAIHGVEWIFINPGTDTAPIQEALVALAARGEPTPKLQVCPDERVAVAAAQGFWLRTGRPQAVIVHVDVGTQAMGAAMHNAQRTNAGIVIIAGRAPRTFDGSLPGGRSIPVHWQQDQPDPAGIVRNYVKWAEEITLVEAMPHLCSRAFQVARSAPAGPVYMTVAREVLMRPVVDMTVSAPARHRAPATPAGCRDAISLAASWLAVAERPIAITARTGRTPEAAAALGELARKLGMPVADARETVNLPSDHPCWLEAEADVTRHLVDADLVLMVDAEVPWVPLVREPSEKALVIQVDRDPVKASMVNWSFAVDLPIQADSAKALPALAAAVDSFAAGERAGVWRRRLDALAAARADRLARRAAEHREERGLQPIKPGVLVEALNGVLPDQAIVMEEVTTNDAVVRERLARTELDTIHAIGAAGLGWAMGAALGVKLAEPDRDVVALCGDGSFMFCAPVAALWAARDAGAPYLTVVFDNQGYRAAKNPVQLLYPAGASARADDFTGTVFAAPPDHAAVARACGAHAERVTDPARLEGALQEALEATRSGTAAVVQVVLEKI